MVVAFAHRSLQRVLKHANLCGHRAAGMEPAALREVNRARRLAFDLEPDQLPLMQARGSSEQRPPVSARSRRACWCTTPASPALPWPRHGPARLQRGAARMHGWAPPVIDAVGTAETRPRVTSACSSRGHAPAAKPGRKHWCGCTPGPRTGTPQRPAQRASCSTTRSAPGDPESRAAGAGKRHRHAGIRGQWRQRPDDHAPLLLPARRLAPARPAQDLP